MSCMTQAPWISDQSVRQIRIILRVSQKAARAS